METKKDVPSVMRRRRKVARQLREQTPEAGGKVKFSDEDSSSRGTGSFREKELPELPKRTIGGHLSKILGRRDKKTSTALARSLSSPKNNTTIDDKPSEIFALMRQARRSLSSPRHKEESSESGQSAKSSIKSKTLEPLPMQQPPHDKNLSQFEKNIIRFEEERRRFIQEKKRFEHEKRELDLMRQKRLENLDSKRNSIDLKSHQVRPTGHELKKQEDVIRKYKPGIKLSLTDSSISKGQPSSPKLTDYESSTASCTSSEHEHELEPVKLVNSDSDDAPENKIKLKRDILTKWVEETQTIMFGKTDEPKIIVEDFGNIQEPEIVKTVAAEELKKQPEKKSSPTIEKVTKVRKKSLQVREIKKKSLVESPKNVVTVGGKAHFREIWRQLKLDHPREVQIFIYERNRSIVNSIIFFIFCGFGALMFRYLEADFEGAHKCVVRKVKRDFVDQLWLSSHNMREEDWKSLARNRLRQFEDELENALEAGVTSRTGSKAWTFINGIIYCMTIVTTIGYGHISPSTTLGKLLTIFYAIIGIPLFLILLADFGKLFTRCIKFVWAFIRRVYYTGSCRKIRKSAPSKEMMKGINMVYDRAIRRPSMFVREQTGLGPTVPENGVEHEEPSPNTLQPPSIAESPMTPIPESFEIDDEFNLPVSVAFTILLLYMFAGAAIYNQWEKWGYFNAFYFVFISMSTIGFGDYVPEHPIFMMLSIIYLLFGLALTSMCINVIQVKLSDHFRHASAKLSQTIGLTMEEEEAARASQNPTPQVPDVENAVEQPVNVTNELLDRNKFFVSEDKPTPPIRRKSQDQSKNPNNNV